MGKVLKMNVNMATLSIHCQLCRCDLTTAIRSHGNSIAALLAVLMFRLLTIGFLVAPMSLSMLGMCDAAEYQNLQSVIDEVKTMKARRASNREIAEFVTRAVDDRIYTLDSPPSRLDSPSDFLSTAAEFSLAPKEAFEVWRKKNIYSPRLVAIWAWENRLGYCEENALTAFHILREAGIENPRVIKSNDHAFVVIGMEPMMREEDVANPHFWPDNAVVIDPWQGLTLDPREAYLNRYIGNKNIRQIVDSTDAYVGRGLKTSESRLIWDTNTKSWETPTESFAPTTPSLSQARKKECRYIKINPNNLEVKSGRQVVFHATAVYADGSEADVTANATWQASAGTAAQVSPRRTWLLSPGSTYTAPGNLSDNENVTIKATWDNCECNS